MLVRFLQRRDDAFRAMWLGLEPDVRWALLAECNGDIANLRLARVAAVAARMHAAKAVTTHADNTVPGGS